MRRKDISRQTFRLEQLEDEQIDIISHFVLRLAYCRTEDLRRWLLTHEVELLKFRLTCATTDEKKRAIREYLPDVQVLHPTEQEDIRAKIVAASGVKSDAGKVYRVPFTQALHLVQHRSVYVHRGQAYIPEANLITLVVNKFRASLSRQLVLLSAVPITPALERTQGFLDNVSSVQAVKDEFDAASVDNLTATNVAAHLQHMPLCMAQLQTALQQEKHLKHWGRLQYGLFLKGAGLSLDDALQYFENMFAQKGFKKEYAYGWRHMYGKEGKRTNYPSYSCSKIINSNAPNANDHHGCPYRHSSVHEVTHLLTKLGVSGPQQKPILAQVQSRNYQLACVEHFKAVHIPAQGRPIDMDNVGNHPNAWFKASVGYSKAGVDSSPSSSDKRITTKPDQVSSTVTPQKSEE
jgi:DNA primase large subunit